MKKFIRKNYQEIVALALIAGFWGSVWGYHMYQSHQAEAQAKADAAQPDPTLFNK
jgi:predicted negative regulator of RcsB-dependent stress response